MHRDSRDGTEDAKIGGTPRVLNNVDEWIEAHVVFAATLVPVTRLEGRDA
jgi:hypothetical protein